MKRKNRRDFMWLERRRVKTGQVGLDKKGTKGEEIGEMKKEKELNKHTLWLEKRQKNHRQKEKRRNIF